MVDADLSVTIEARTGLAFRGHQRGRMLGVVAAEQRRLGCRSDRDYVRALASDDAAFGSLIDRLVVGETYFFRDADQMDHVRAVFARLAEGSSRPVRVWSAGCASGEEAYTLAVLGREAGLGGRLRVLGTDVSAAAVERARQGTYSSWSFRAIDEEASQGWFDPVTRAVRPEVAAMVQFRTENLLHGPPGRFDLVLCRNVLMYLTRDARRRAGEVLAASLEPGGVLLIGASDPLMVVAGLAHTRALHGLAYHLAGDPAAEADVVGGAPSPRPPRPPKVVHTPTRNRGPAPSPAPVGAPPQVDASLELRALVEDGRADEARQLLAAAIAADPMDAQLRCLAATLLLDGADPAGAAREARASLYLDPERGVAHVLLAHSLRALGRAEAAEREYRRAAAVLARADGAGLDDAEAGLSALVQQLTEGAGRG